jgi:hypothetical protein
MISATARKNARAVRVLFALLRAQTMLDDARDPQTPVRTFLNRLTRRDNLRRLMLIEIGRVAR